MGREEGGFQAFLTQLPLLIVCRELIIWRLSIYGSAMVWNVGAVFHVKPSRSLYITDIFLPEVLCFLEVDMNYLQTRLCEPKKSLEAPVFGF